MRRRRMIAAITGCASAAVLASAIPAHAEGSWTSSMNGVELAGSADIVVSTHQTENLSEVYDHVVVLSDGVVRFTGTVQEFYALAPRDTASGRVADGAYTAVLGGGEAW